MKFPKARPARCNASVWPTNCPASFRIATLRRATPRKSYWREYLRKCWVTNSLAYTKTSSVQVETRSVVHESSARFAACCLCDLPITTLFRYPTIAELAHEIIQNARPERPTIPQRKDRAFSPLSLAQQRLWFVEQLEPEHSINNVIRTLHLRGYLDQTALEFGINKIIERHEILRTTFSVHDGEAMQNIAPHLPFTLTTIDLKHLSPDQQKDEAKRIAKNEAHHSFELARPPLMRAALLQLGQQEHVLIITLHHIISDGWSMGVFSRELETFYRSTLLNDPAELPEPPIQYADYAEWQRDWFQGEAITPLTDYWKKQLSNATRLELPADRPRTKQPDYNTALCSLQLSAELTKKIRQMGREENCTLFMTLLACFNVLLHRYTGETDIVIGAPISGRHGLDEIKDLIGSFVNTLALRTDLSGDPSFRQLLGRVRKMALEAYRHSDTPFRQTCGDTAPGQVRPPQSFVRHHDQHS